MTWYQLSTVSHVVLLNFFQALGNVKDQVLHPWKRIVGSHPPSWRLVLTVPQPATLHSGQAASSQETWAHRLPAAQGTFPWEPFSTWSWVQTGWATVATTAVAVKRLAAKNLPSFQIHHIWFCEVSLEFFCQVFFGFFVSYSATDSCLSLPKKTNMIKKYIVHVGLAVLINPGYRSFSWSSSHFVIQYFTKHLTHHRLAICRSLHEVTVAFSGERTCHQNKLQACGCGVPFWPQELKKQPLNRDGTIKVNTVVANRWPLIKSWINSFASLDFPYVFSSCNSVTWGNNGKQLRVHNRRTCMQYEKLVCM